MQSELLTTDELSARIKYDVRTIRERLKDSVLLEGADTCLSGAPSGYGADAGLNGMICLPKFASGVR